MNLKTIAKLAGVSTVTVSNVLNGKYNRASEETVERILKIVAENNYQPSATARSLITKKSRIIGVMIPWIRPGESFSKSPYNSQMLGYLSSYIRDQGYYMMPRCVLLAHEILPDIATWNVDGLFVLSTFAKDALELSEKLTIPTVFIDTYPANSSLVSVGTEDYQGGYLATKYLLDKGHRKIAFAGTSIDYPGVIQERYLGFHDAYRDLGLEPVPEHIFELGDTSYQVGEDAGQKIAAAEQQFTAVVSMSDIASFGIMEGLRMGGLRVPEDVSIIGFDDLPECQYSHPKLTTISQHLEEKARLAGECLFSMLRGGDPPAETIKVDVELIERQSVIPLTTSEKAG